MKFIKICFFFLFIEIIHTFCWYVEARLSIEVHNTPVRTQNIINALHLCYMLTYFIGSFSNKVKNSVLTNANWISIFFGLGHGVYNLQINT